MRYVQWGALVGIYSSRTKTRQKARKWPNGDYLCSPPYLSISLLDNMIERIKFHKIIFNQLTCKYVKQLVAVKNVGSISLFSFFYFFFIYLFFFLSFFFFVYNLTFSSSCYTWLDAKNWTNFLRNFSPLVSVYLFVKM